MLVPLDLRLTTFSLEDGSEFAGQFRSESIDDEEEALVGEEADGCGACDWDAEVDMGDGFDADIAALFVCCSVNCDD
jgi:hypothetical protein